VRLCVCARACVFTGRLPLQSSSLGRACLPLHTTAAHYCCDDTVARAAKVTPPPTPSLFRITLSPGLFASAFPPATEEEETSAQADWSGSPVIIFVLRRPRRSLKQAGGAEQPGWCHSHFLNLAVPLGSVG
jgi:hypothetical protein